MTDSWDLTIRLTAPAGSSPGPVTRAGAVSLTARQVLRVLPAVSSYAADGERLTVRLEVFEPRRTAGEIEALALSARVPELAGWGFAVRATPLFSSMVDVREDSGLPGPVAPGESPGRPSGPGGDLVRQAGERLRGLDLTGFAAGGVLAGCLVQAADLVIEELFDDLHALEAGLDPIEDLPQLSALPERYHKLFTPEFTRAFVVTCAEVRFRLTTLWAPLTCTAQELALTRIFDETEDLADGLDLDLPDDWRSELSAGLLREAEVDLLYDPRPEREPVPFDDWFTPYPG